MYKRIFEIDGTIETAEEINEAYREATGDPEPLFETDPENLYGNQTINDWRAWVEYENGKTYVLADEA